MAVSIANSLRFMEENVLMKSFNNVLSVDDVYANMLAFSFKHQFISTDSIPIQVAAAAAPVVTFIDDSGTRTVLTSTANTVIGSLTYYDYTMTAVNGYVEVVADTVTYISECIDLVDTSDIKIEWFNYDNTADFNYGSGIVNINRFEGSLRNYAPVATSTIYDNQSEKVKLKEVLFRQYDVAISGITMQLAEKIAVAFAHDVVTVNDIEVVAEKPPAMTPLPNTNLYDVTITVTEKNSILINRHDSGSSGGSPTPTPTPTPTNIGYLNFLKNIDPTGLGTPATGIKYAGVYNNTWWIKNDDNTIVYFHPGKLHPYHWTAGTGDVGNTGFTILELIGAEILWLERGTQKLDAGTYSFNPVTGVFLGLSPTIDLYEDFYITYRL